ncbi:Uncharacterised protein [uncultured archaeon]|nr:Uncharacterised protein [uncultured archaeon]
MVHALDIDRRGRRVQLLRQRQPRQKGVPFRPGCDLALRLKALRHLALAGDAEHPGLPRHHSHPRRAGRILNREGQIGVGCDSRPKLVAYGPCQLEQRPALGCGPQVALVCDALLVEREHVCYCCPGIKKGNGRIVQVSCLQGCQWTGLLIGKGHFWQTCQHAQKKILMSSYAAVERVFSRTVIDLTAP